MSSFLSAAENVARQRQNVRRDVKKDGGRKSHNLFIFGLCCTRKKNSITVRQLHLYFWYHYDAVDAR